MLPFFNMDGRGLPSRSFHKASTKAELEEILGKESVQKPERVQVVEIVMDMIDVPWRLVDADCHERARGGEGDEGGWDSK